MTDVINSNASYVIARQNGAWLANVFSLAPAQKTITDVTLQDNTQSQFDDVGIPTPNGTPTLALINVGAGNLTANATYSYYVTNYDSVRGLEGDPVQTGNVTIGAGGDDVRITLTPITNENTNSRTDQFRIYRNISGGTTYFLVDTIANSSTTYDDTATDASISTNDTVELDNEAWTATDNFGYCHVHKGFLFAGGP